MRTWSSSCPSAIRIRSVSAAVVLSGSLGCATSPSPLAQSASPESAADFDAHTMTYPQPRGCAPGPVRSDLSRTLGITGTVLVEYIVSKDGRAGSVRMLNDDAPALL